jgi:GNAT superfamily N-acetyltransferase
MSFLLRRSSPGDRQTASSLVAGCAIDAGDREFWLDTLKCPKESSRRRLHCSAIEHNSGALLGYGAAEQDADGRSYRLLLAAPRGHAYAAIARLLFRRLERELRHAAAACVWARVLEHDPSVAYLKSEGFSEGGRRVFLRLGLQQRDISDLERGAAASCPERISIITLAQAQESDLDWCPRIYALAKTVHRGATWSLDEYLERFRQPGCRPEAVFIAIAEGLYVGYSQLGGPHEAGDSLNQSMTGVRPEFRRRGIARALKLKGIEYALQEGYAGIVTNCAATNAPMLALNAGLGFRRQFDEVTLEKRLDQ